MKKENILSVFLMIVIGVIAIVGTVSAATTISTDIITDGNVGIGTSTPYAKLSVAGQAVVNNIWATSTTATNYFGGNVGIGTASLFDTLSVVSTNKTLSGGRGQIGVFSSEDMAIDLGGQIILGGVDATGGTPTRSFAAIAGRKENGTSGNRAGYLQFSTRVGVAGDLIEYVRITSTGNVGIGTTSPATKLHVSSGASATTTVSIGELRLSSSKACVNMNRSDGSANSFYFNAAGALVSEANYCR